MVLPNSFETTQKFDVAGVAVGVCDRKMEKGVSNPRYDFPYFQACDLNHSANRHFGIKKKT